MNAAHNRIGLDDEIVPRRGTHHGGVVEQSESPGAAFRQGGEIAGKELEFTTNVPDSAHWAKCRPRRRQARDRLFLRPNHKDSARRVAHDALGHAAEECTSSASSTVAADHDDVRRPLSGSSNDLIDGPPVDHELEGRWLEHQTLTTTGQQPLPFPLGVRDKLILRNTRLSAVRRRCFDGVDQRNLSAKRMSKVAADFGGVRRDRAAVDGDEHAAKAHGFALSWPKPG